MKLDFVITNNKASYVAKGERICLFSVAKEMALKEQWIKPCVPFCIQSVSSSFNYCYKAMKKCFEIEDIYEAKLNASFQLEQTVTKD